MAMSNLSTHEMIGLSGAWLDDARHRKTLLASPRASHLMTDLDKVHHALVAIVATETTSPEMSALQAEEASVDSTHDRKARGTNKFLEALAELADTDEQRTSIKVTTDALFPQGLGFVNTTYAAEAGNTEATERRLGDAPAAQDLLAKTILPWGGSLLDEVHVWFGAGHELGKLEARRAELRAIPSSRPASSANSKARGRWLNVVSALLASIGLDDEPAAEVQAHVLAPLAEATARADARAVRRKEAKAARTEPTPPTPAPAG